MIVLPSAPLRSLRQRLAVPSVLDVAWRARVRAAARRQRAEEPEPYVSSAEWALEQAALENRRERERPLTPAETAKAAIIREAQRIGGSLVAYILDPPPIGSQEQVYVARMFSDFGQEEPAVQWVREVRGNENAGQAAKSFVTLRKRGLGGFITSSKANQDVINLVKQVHIPLSELVAHEACHVLYIRDLKADWSVAHMEAEARVFQKLVGAQLEVWRRARTKIDYGRFAALWMRVKNG